MITNRIKEYRARFDLKQEELAKRVGVRRETIGNLEKGRYNPSLVLAWNIASTSINAVTSAAAAVVIYMPLRSTLIRSGLFDRFR